MQYLSATLCVILLAMCIGCRNKLSEYVDFPKDGVVSSMSLRQAIANEKSLQENSAYLHTATRQVTVEKILGDGRLIVGDGTDYFILATKSDLDIGQPLSTGAYLYKGMDEIDDLFGKRIELPYFCEINPCVARQMIKRRCESHDEHAKVLSEKQDSQTKVAQRKQIYHEIFTSSEKLCGQRKDARSAPASRTPPSRCVARYSDGNRCREMATGNTQLCKAHCDYDPSHPPFRLDEELPTNDVERVIVTKRKLGRVQEALTYHQTRWQKIPDNWAAINIGLPMNKVPPRKDAWGQNFELLNSGDVCIVRSAGADGVQGTSDDIQITVSFPNTGNAVTTKDIGKLYAELTTYKCRVVPSVCGFSFGTKMERVGCVGNVKSVPLNTPFNGISNAQLGYEGVYSPRLVSVLLAGQSNETAECLKMISVLEREYDIKMSKSVIGGIVRAEYEHEGFRISVRNDGFISADGDDVYVVEFRDNRLSHLIQEIDRQMDKTDKNKETNGEDLL